MHIYMTGTQLAFILMDWPSKKMFKASKTREILTLGTYITYDHYIERMRLDYVDKTLIYIIYKRCELLYILYMQNSAIQNLQQAFHSTTSMRKIHWSFPLLHLSAPDLAPPLKDDAEEPPAAILRLQPTQVHTPIYINCPRKVLGRFNLS